MKLDIDQRSKADGSQCILAYYGCRELVRGKNVCNITKYETVLRPG